VAEHRRRRRNAEELPQEAISQTADIADELPAQDGQPAAPRRRRRAQPPQQITQRMKRISVPEDAPIPRMPVIEEPQPEKKRYKKAAKPHKTEKPYKTEKPHKTAKSKDQAAVAERREKNAQRLKNAADAGKKGVRAVGVLLLLLLSALAKGFKGLGALVMHLAARVRTLIARPAARQTQEEEQEVVLEAIRPQDYHGRSAQHVKAQPQKKKNMAAVLPDLSGAKAQRLISAALVLVAAVSLWQIGSILLRTFRTTRLNAQLSERYASMGGNVQEDENRTDDAAFVVFDGEETPEPTPVPTPEPAPEPEKEQETQKPSAPRATAEPELVKITEFHHVGGDALPEMEALYNENRDLVAWLNIPDVIDLPVVYKDNDYYLKRDFYKQKNTAGTIFLDENHPFKEKTQNLLLHGHNMKDGTMFGRLTQYIYDRTYIKNHPFINLSTLWRKEQYVIFAVLDVSLDPRNEAFFNYFTHSTFSSDAEFTSYIRQLQLRSMFAIPIDVEPTDALLTLSTCLEENRLVIVARRLRPDETRQEMRDRIHTATRQ